MTVVSMAANTPLEQQINALETQFSKLTELGKQIPDIGYAERIQDLTCLQRVLKIHTDALVDALSQDYGHRSRTDTLMADIMPCFQMLRYTKRKLKRWMKPSRRSTGLLLAPAKVEIHYQPLGVVGIIVPWNFPITLSLIPLMTAIAAGNRVMLKMSEFTPLTNQVVKTMLTEAFSEDKVSVIEGDVAVATAFTKLPFDHLLFTGSTEVGKKVMEAASANLTPVTLELGGKSPVIIAPDIAPEIAAERLLFGKNLNAGQICVAPDHLYVHEDKLDDVVEALRAQWKAAYPEGIQSDDRTAIINDRQFARLESLIDDAQKRGVTVIPLSEEAILPATRKMALHLVINPPADSVIMQQEIFGPLLPIITYHDVQDVLTIIRNMPRPLALYLMSFDEDFKRHVIRHTHSGSIAVNDTITQVAVDDAPFGGVGPSGLGHYHGIEGFRTFSHAKTVLSRGKFNPGKLMTPPYGKWWQKIMFTLFLR
ncbi:coniferyl-aldehyde dehydrogenase [Enterovibrio norvegicus FF-162]|uniref:Aldehyde dehydrogenase n=1 Tax=Enterovibrio norvegicus FF-454 TaxID=1185651 RepID=A0A1E5CDZ4_9GAMM|nr:coniferyl aldehyde dehydrogenase [Enterovibrio norvegicus]OEE63655.1 coniferyl-aldehyde dehydrogenase [Enterovibrio norvegicus FF-454]OEE84266.1 coniferyl-aldehyde dehydrogenase [Enterovibrio norvegicus FF-162]